MGCTDVMVDHTAQVNTCPPQENSCSAKDETVVDLCVSTSQGSFIRLYYPCREPEGAEKPDWIPCREYFNGLADFMKINRTLSERIFNYLYGNLYFMCFISDVRLHTGCRKKLVVRFCSLMVSGHFEALKFHCGKRQNTNTSRITVMPACIVVFVDFRLF